MEGLSRLTVWREVGGFHSQRLRELLPGKMPLQRRAMLHRRERPDDFNSHPHQSIPWGGVHMGDGSTHPAAKGSGCGYGFQGADQPQMKQGASARSNGNDVKTWTPPFSPTELSPRFSETGGEDGGRVPPKLTDPGFLT